MQHHETHDLCVCAPYCSPYSGLNYDLNIDLLWIFTRFTPPLTMLEKMLTYNEGLELLGLAKIILKEKEQFIRVNIDYL